MCGRCTDPVSGDSRAEKLIHGCEYCHEDDADIPFDWILDKITGRSGATTDYIMTEPAGCRACKHEITEKDACRTIMVTKRDDAGAAASSHEAGGIPRQAANRTE
jgi:hypothetical protein